MARPTIRDVAELAGVSTATVSYVLNGTGSVSAETAARVRQCVDQLGYRANTLAVAHRTGRSSTIGLAVPDLTNPFFPEFAQGVHQAASAEGFSVLLLDAHNSNDDEIEGVERLSDRVPEGLIWCPVRRDIITERDYPFPTVVYDRMIEGFDSVRADIWRGGELQAEHVLEYGHRVVGLLSGPLWSDTAQQRREGFLERVGDDATVAWDFPLDFSSEIPDDMRRRILEFDDVTCVVAANDIQAMRLMQLYRSAGRIVPDDVSVIGFDDIDLAHVVSPPLTTVHLGTRQLGFAAFRVLIERIKNPDAPIRNETLDVSMTLRDSLRRL